MLLSRTAEEKVVSDVTCVEDFSSVQKATTTATKAATGTCVQFVLKKKCLSD